MLVIDILDQECFDKIQVYHKTWKKIPLYVLTLIGMKKEADQLVESNDLVKVLVFGQFHRLQYLKKFQFEEKQLENFEESKAQFKTLFDEIIINGKVIANSAE